MSSQRSSSLLVAIGTLRCAAPLTSLNTAPSGSRSAQGLFPSSSPGISTAAARCRIRYYSPRGRRPLLIYGTRQTYGREYAKCVTVYYSTWQLPLCPPAASLLSRIANPSNSIEARYGSTPSILPTPFVARSRTTSPTSFSDGLAPRLPAVYAKPLRSSPRRRHVLCSPHTLSAWLSRRPRGIAVPLASAPPCTFSGVNCCMLPHPPLTLLVDRSEHDRVRRCFPTRRRSSPPVPRLQPIPALEATERRARGALPNLSRSSPRSVHSALDRVAFDSAETGQALPPLSRSRPQD
ncbi:hypothetical protein MSAN_00964100 [Mycena sanguinolenta]|uniref:Uncharacterized protein n=1 Tax=Mycena sanguinolenta TaxID=230812 RepID=A0A8H6YXJ8_9AGAR|nr:hypothetical protein MSAN_00964100 [Mycena sanguinolenta]